MSIPVYISLLIKPVNVVVLLISYLLLHFLLRLSFGSVLGLDDAEQALFAQQWAWSYRFEQPPLFTWLLYPTFELLGVNVLALSLWRYFWLGVILLGSYRLLLKWFCWQANSEEDRLYAGLATLGLLLIYVIAYFSHHDLTHTTIMTAFIVLGLLQFTRLIENPHWKNYLLLGLVFAGGLLGKWNFIVFCMALIISCLVLSSYRPLLLTGKTLLAIGVTTILVLPTLWFVANLERPYVDIAEAALSNQKVSGFATVLAKGSAKLTGSLLVYLLPFLLFAGLIFYRPLRSGWSALRKPELNTLAAPKPHQQGPVCSPVSPQFLLVFSLSGITLLWLLIPLLGAVRFTERWMQPVLFPLPFLVLMLVRLGNPDVRKIRNYLLAVLAFSVLAFVVRIGMDKFSADRCGSCRALIPFPELAAQLSEAGFKKGTIIADRFHIGGNMRLSFPDSRVIDPHYPLAVWPDDQGEGQCLWVWETARSKEQPPEHFQPFVTSQLAAAWRPPDRQGVATALLHGSEQRTYSLSWWLFEQPLGYCR